MGQPQNSLITCYAIQFSFTRCKSVLSRGNRKYVVVKTLRSRQNDSYFVRYNFQCISTETISCQIPDDAFARLILIAKAPLMPLALCLHHCLANWCYFCQYAFPQTYILIEYIGSLENTQGIHLGMTFDKNLGLHPVDIQHINLISLGSKVTAVWTIFILSTFEPSEWVISFRANYSNQMTCIPFAVTNKALPVKGLAKDPINKLIFCNFSSWVLMRKMTWIRVEVVNECKQKWKLKTYQVSRNFTIYTSCCQRSMVDTLQFKWRFNLRGVLPIAYINQTYTIYSVYYFSGTGV